MTDIHCLSFVCLRLAGYMKSCFLLVTCESLRKMCGEKLANDLRDAWEVGRGRARKRTQSCMKSRTRSFTSARTENGECICHFSLALIKEHNPHQSNLWKKGLVWLWFHRVRALDSRGKEWLRLLTWCFTTRWQHHQKGRSESETERQINRSERERDRERERDTGRWRGGGAGGERGRNT